MSEQIDTAVRWATKQLESCSDSPRLDAELLLAHCLDKPRSHLYAWPQQTLTEACWQRFQALVQQRLLPTPVAYLLGRREFFSMEYATTPAALVPRAETELLVELALREIPQDRALRICDLGTGSGIIAITIKKQRPLTSFWATDVDPACLALARENALRHEVEIDPPYVAADHPFLAQGDLPAEPAIALSPGASGLEALEIIIARAPDYLEPGGMLIVEHGYDQEAAVAALLRAAGFEQIRCESDLNDLPRASIARLPKPR
jgi:release factor glutamine methyltransferase